MQNRRIPADDNRGMGEYMNEVDELGHGIRVPATYYIQIFDQSETASLQRKVQLGKTDHPPQLIYSFNTSQETKSDDFKQPTYYSDYGISDEVNMVAIPIDGDALLIRLENVGDLLDK